jgi:uncharacterized membrane protein (UPF0127 family)
MIALLLSFAGCIGSTNGGSSGNNNSAGGSDRRQSGSAALRRFPLDTLPTSTVTIGPHTFRVWLATIDAQRTEGLMHVTDAEIADDQGMLFVFGDEQERSFWMRNTIIPLDIAYMRTNGTIVQTHTMPPLTLKGFPSIEPARFVLEVKAGTFERLGVQRGDVVVIPPELSNTSP